MSEIREIITKAIVAKGKKTFNISHQLQTSKKPYSILGCWIINHHYEALKENDIVKIKGAFEINIWYSLDNNTKTDVLKETIFYEKEIKTKQIVADYLKNSDAILVKILKQPTAINAKIDNDKIDIDIVLEILAEVLGETKMQVTIMKPVSDELDDIELEINEDFLEEMDKTL